MSKMSRPNTRDGNDNVYKQQTHPDESDRAATHIVTPKRKKNSDKTTYSAIEAQTESNSDRQEADNNALLSLDADSESQIKNPLPKPWKSCLFGILIILLCAAAAILGYYLGNRNHATEEVNMTDELEMCRARANTMKKALSDPGILADLHEGFINMIHDKPTPWLQAYYRNQPYSGSSLDAVLVSDIVNHLHKSGVFDEIKIENYTVLASLPDPDGSLIQVVNRSSQQVLYRERIVSNIQDTSYKIRRSIHIGGNSSNKNESSQLPIPPFVAYSTAGTVKGELVNINEASESDFEALVNAGVILDKNIGLLKTGGVQETVAPLVDKIRRAVAYNISAILVYTDSNTCDTSVNYDSLNLAGDPQTPGYPSIDGVWRLPLKDLAFPEVPVQTISCSTAHRLLNRLEGQAAPPGWQGSYNGTLRMGRKSNKAAEWFVQLDSTTHNTELTIQNVLATIRGFIEPRHVIMLGASRNSFSAGHQGVSMSTDALLKLAHPLSEMLKANNWLPKRSMTFSFWGGAEFGDIGRTEHMEQTKGGLDEIIAYLDLDNPRSQLTSQLSIISPPALQEFVRSVLHVRITAVTDEEAYGYDERAYSDDEDDDDDEYPSSGLYDAYDSVISAFKSVKLVDPEDLPALSYTLMPLVQVSQGHKSALPMDSLQLTEITRLYAALMLSLSDNTILQYDNVATARAVKTGIRRLIFQAYDLNNHIKVALETHAAHLYDNTAVFDHMIDNRMDCSDVDHVHAVNDVLVQLNHQLSTIQHRISQLLENFPDKRPKTSDDLLLGDDLDLKPMLQSDDAATMRQISELLVSMHRASDLMKTVHFQVKSDVKSNGTDSIYVSNEDYSDLERGWA